jgi:hypothetical protein
MSVRICNLTIVRAVAVAVAAAIAGRAAPVHAQRPAANAAVASIIDTVTLRESDSLYLASPTFISPAPGGGVFVSELFASRVIQYDAAGNLVATIGRKGTGPGEFVSPGATVVVADSLLVVHDIGQRAFVVFNRKTGRFVRLVREEGVPTAIAASRDTVLLGVINMRKNRMTSLASWPVVGDSIRYFGPLPSEYIRSRQLAQTLPLAAFTRVAGGILVGYAGHQDLFLTDGNGAVRDTINIPIRVRRGVPRDLVDQYERPQTSQQEAARNSVVVALHRLRSGGIAAVHFDYTVNGDFVTAKGFLSLLDPTLHRACVDAPLNLGDDARPLVMFRGDTLVVLEQRLVSSDKSVSQLRAYRIDPAACEWQPVGKPGRS